MSTWEVLLAINLFLGLLAFLLASKANGEVKIKDLVSGFFIMSLGFITFWFLLYEVYSKQIDIFLKRASKVGEVPLWRSRGTKAKEVLFGEVDTEEDDDDF